MSFSMRVLIKTSFGACAALALFVATDRIEAAVVGRAVSAAGDLNVTNFNVNADGDSFPFPDRSPIGAPDGVFDSGVNRFDVFGVVQRTAVGSSDGSTAGISGDLLDDTKAFFSADDVGIVRGGDPANGVPVDTAPFFGVEDTIDATDTSHSGVQQAVWTFNTASASGGFTFSVDVAAMGDFETADLHGFEYSFNGGSSYTPIFGSEGLFADTNFTTISGSFVGAIDQSVAGQDAASLPASVKYTMESGAIIGLNDPLQFAGQRLSNEFQTFTKSLTGTGSQLLIRFFAQADGTEVFAFRNMTLTDGAVVGVPGDYNGNGTVDAADYVLWRNGGPLLNEVDTPGTVNAADYAAWRARFGNSGSGSGLGAANVPEPTSLVLVLIGMLPFCVRRRVG